MKKYFRSILYIFGIILILLLFLTIFNYFNIITGTLFNVIKFIIPLTALFVGGFIIGKKSQKKGWINGVKLGLILVTLFVILSLIFSFKIEVKSLLYYLILIFSSMLGSVIGINKKHQ